MTRAQKILIAVIVALLLLLLGLLVFLRLRPQTAAPVGNQNAAVNTPGGGLPGGNFNGPGFNANISGNVNGGQPPEQVDSRNNLQRIAAAFAERYGSFSTASNFENLVDVEAFMTTPFAAQTQAYVDAQRSQQRAAEFAGTTTRSITVTVDSFDETGGSAALTVNTQRRAQGSTLADTQVYYQSLKLTFKKQGQAWLVDSAVWQPR